MDRRCLSHIPEELLAEVLPVVAWAVNFVNPFLQPEDRLRMGDYFCIWWHEPQIQDVPLAVTKVGIVPTQKARKYLELCQEKAARLFDNGSHLSSWQSRDIDAGRYGGAIKLDFGILSFSGLPELADEAIMLIVAIKLRQMRVDRAREISTISNNLLFERMLCELFKQEPALDE